MGRARSIVLVGAGLLAAVVPALRSGTGAAAADGGNRHFTVVDLKGAAGGEPSIVADHLGTVVVAGPQGIPSGVNNGTPGAAVWVSHDHGDTFGRPSLIGSELGGGDEDLAVASDNTVYLGDLEAAATAVCKTTDHGRTFQSIGPAPDPGNCGGVEVGQAGPSADRPWLTTDDSQSGVHRVYLTYHEFVSAQPVVFRDDAAGNHLFTDGPCGPIVTDPTIEADVPTDVTGGTLVSKPVVDGQGDLYVMFTTTTQQQNVEGATGNQQPSGSFSQVYLAVSRDHCRTFTDSVVYDGSKMGTNSVQFGDIFNSLAVDGAGDLYAVASGFVGRTAYAPTANVFIFSSTNHGRSWTGPTRLTGTTEADMLPAAVGGPRAGDLSIGYFRTINGVTNPNNTAARWTYEVATSHNATAARPGFASGPVSGTDRSPFVYHIGDICNAGILCGIAPGSPGDRSLLDFTSATLGPDLCPLFTFAGNPSGTNDGAHTDNYVARQRSDCFKPSR